jgi:hypothetical protein
MKPVREAGRPPLIFHLRPDTGDSPHLSLLSGYRAVPSHRALLLFSIFCSSDDESSATLLVADSSAPGRYLWVGIGREKS